MPFQAGITDLDSLENEPVPGTFAEICDSYQKYGDALVDHLVEKWTDTDLLQVIEVYGQQWEKRKILSSLIKHQIHHRAQMTVIMRLQNIPVPGTYGPSKEEWSKFGMAPQE